MDRKARKRQREEENEATSNKKPKIQVPKIFEDKEFMLNEEDPDLKDLIEKYGGQVYLFAYWGGGYNVIII